MNADEIKTALAQRAEDFCRWLYPLGKRQGREWKIGNLDGEPGDSFGIIITGPKAGTFKDFADSEKGGDNLLELYCRARRADFPTALRACADWLGASLTPREAMRLPTRSTSTKASVGMTLPADASPGTESDWRALGALRSLSWVAPAKAAALGTLYFGTVCGARCWIITDERQLCAEARRVDGQPFSAIGDLSERKAHTLKGSVKSWPVGLAVRGFTPADFRAILAVEGGPDYLAALHFTLKDKADCLPIAFLGAGAGGTIHPDALALLRGRPVRFYPHHEPSGVGMEACRKWAAQIRAIGCVCDAADFSGLRKVDGSPVKDLNDCTAIHPADAAELEGLLP